MHWGLLLAHCVVLTKSTQLSDLTLLFHKKKSVSPSLFNIQKSYCTAFIDCYYWAFDVGRHTPQHIRE